MSSRTVRLMRAHRHPIERFGLGLTAAGLLIATAIAWVVHRIGWGQTDYTMASDWDAYQDAKWAATQGCVVIGIVFAVLGVILVLAGKAMHRQV